MFQYRTRELTKYAIGQCKDAVRKFEKLKNNGYFSNPVLIAGDKEGIVAQMKIDAIPTRKNVVQVLKGHKGAVEVWVSYQWIEIRGVKSQDRIPQDIYSNLMLFKRK